MASDLLPDETETWKTKLLESTREWEQQERHWQALTEGLRRALVRVSLAADGLDPRLDSQLAELREAVRDDGDPSRLERLVEAIAQTLLDLEGQGHKAPRGAASPSLQPWLTPLRRLARDPALLTRLEKLEHRLRRDTEVGASDWEEALSLLGVIADSANAPAREGGWWRRLRPAALPAPAPADRSIAERVRDILRQLLEELNLPPEFNERVEPLRTRLRGELSTADLPPLVEAAARLVLDSTKEESAELQAFLRQLTDRLGDIHKLLRDSARHRRQHQQESAALDEAIQAEVRGLQHRLTDATDLDELKTAATRQLEGLAQRMREFFLAQQTYNEQTERHLHELTARLQDTEQETEQLRASLLQQQLRAQLDPLTEVANREAYGQRLDYEYARWRRYRTPLSLVVGDVDHFKRINDRFGHSTGDKVLRTIARTLKANMRETDFVARYGGEEFVILMPQTGLQQAAQAADKLRRAVESRPFHAGAERVPVTMSFGVAEIGEDDGVEAVFDRADQALYLAKGSGRNQVVTAPPGGHAGEQP